MAWIAHPLILQGNMVSCIPMEEAHYDALLATSQDKDMWQYMAENGSDPEILRGIIHKAIQNRETGTEYPFVIIDKPGQRIIGSTRFLRIEPEHRKLEIGFTWLSPAYWGKGHNYDCKLAMLQYCFEVLKTTRVQIVARDNNMRSRRAIEKLGAQYEGILRNNVVRGGTPRNNAFYSIIDSEWEDVKIGLTKLLSQRK